MGDYPSQKPPKPRNQASQSSMLRHAHAFFPLPDRANRAKKASPLKREIPQPIQLAGPITIGELWPVATSPGVARGCRFWRVVPWLTSRWLASPCPPWNAGHGQMLLIHRHGEGERSGHAPP